MQGGPGAGLYWEPDLKQLGGRLLVLCGSGKHGLEDGTWAWEWCPRQECEDHLHDEISLVQKHHLPCMFRCCPQKALCVLTFLAPPALCTQKRRPYSQWYRLRSGFGAPRNPLPLWSLWLWVAPRVLMDLVLAEVWGGLWKWLEHTWPKTDPSSAGPVAFLK